MSYVTFTNSIIKRIHTKLFMNSYLLLFVFVSFISKSYTQTINKPDERVINGEILPEAIPTKRIVCDYHVAKQPTKINATLKENLQGIWASDEYREILFSTNSVTKAQKEYQFYTDIVFDQDSTLHFNRPDMMEEDYFYLYNDSSLVSMLDKNDGMRIVSAEKSKLIVRDSQGNNHSFTKMKEEANLEWIFQEVSEGSKAIESLWLKGDYTFESKSNNFKLTINDDGSVISDQKIERIDVFSYMNEDILWFGYGDYKYKTYAVKSYSEDEILLQEMKPLEEEDQPIEYLKSSAKLRRKPL